MGKLFDELKELKKAYDKKLKSGGEAAVKEAFKEVFSAHPEIASIWWTQYTPYFNDGDSCTFGVNEFSVDLVSDEKEKSEDDEDEDDYDNEGRHDVYSLVKSKDKTQRDIGKAVAKLEKELPEDILEHVFGDHTKIVATPKGFVIKEYEHD